MATIDQDFVLDDVWVLAHHSVDCTGKDVDAADHQHVVGSADDAAPQSCDRGLAWCLVLELDDVTGSIAKQRRALATEVREH